MISTAFYERRKGSGAIDFNDRVAPNGVYGSRRDIDKSVLRPEFV